MSHQVGSRYHERRIDCFQRRKLYLHQQLGLIEVSEDNRTIALNSDLRERCCSGEDVLRGSKNNRRSGQRSSQSIESLHDEGVGSDAKV